MFDWFFGKECPKCKSRNTKKQRLDSPLDGVKKYTCQSCSHVFGHRCPECNNLASFSAFEGLRVQTKQVMGGYSGGRPHGGHTDYETERTLTCNFCGYKIIQTRREESGASYDSDGSWSTYTNDSGWSPTIDGLVILKLLKFE